MNFFVYDFMFYVFFQITLSILCISLFTIATPFVAIVNVNIDSKLPVTAVSQFGFVKTKTKKNENALKSRENVMLVLLSLEMGIGALCFLSVGYSLYVPTLFGHIIVLVLIILAGSESALGLAMLMTIYKIYNMISFDTLTVLKG